MDRIFLTIVEMSNGMNAESITVMDIDWSEKYGILSPGEYRIIKAVSGYGTGTASEKSSMETEVSYDYIATDFSLEQKL